MVRDPVCGMQPDTKQTAVLWAASQHAGATYHFPAALGGGSGVRLPPSAAAAGPGRWRRARCASRLTLLAPQNVMAIRRVPVHGGSFGPFTGATVAG